MGTQVRFYALPSDEKTFWAYVQTLPGTIRLNIKSRYPSIKYFIHPWDEDEQTIGFRKLYISNLELNLLCPYFREGLIKKYSEKELDYVDTGENIHWIDSSAPLVEFSSSFIRNDGKLMKGRIWADYYRLEGKEFVYKGDDFKKFYETLAKWIRNNFKRVKGIDGYFGQEALTWYEGGGKIVF